MAVGLVLTAPGMTADDYDALTTVLGLSAGGADWPDGLISHVAGSTSDGWYVLDVWESQDAADAFIGGRLRLAFEQVGGLPQPRVTQVDVHLLRGHGTQVEQRLLR